MPGRFLRLLCSSGPVPRFHRPLMQLPGNAQKIVSDFAYERRSPTQFGDRRQDIGRHAHRDLPHSQASSPAVFSPVSCRSTVPQVQQHQTMIVSSVCFLPIKLVLTVCPSVIKSILQSCKYFSETRANYAICKANRAQIQPEPPQRLWIATGVPGACGSSPVPAHEPHRLESGCF